MPAEKTLHQWVVFRVVSREYALRLEHVAEVLRMVALTPTPEAPAWLSGLINLRGRVIPVIDVRTRLGHPPQTLGLNTPIVVVKTDDQREVGLIADEVVELLTLPAEVVTRPDAMLGAAHPVSATLHIEGRLIVALDLERLCAGSENLALV
ncbi:MAG: chemotaxis protein CheW [Anaerolineales bacterium]